MALVFDKDHLPTLQTLPAISWIRPVNHGSGNGLPYGLVTDSTTNESFLAVLLKEEYCTLVSLIDEPWVRDHRFFLFDNHSGLLYARETIKNGKALHQLILPNQQCIDHINRCGLDNRRENLRTVTFSANSRNATLHRESTTGIKGVSHIIWLPAPSWVANVSPKGRKPRAKSFPTSKYGEDGARIAAIAFWRANCDGVDMKNHNGLPKGVRRREPARPDNIWQASWVDDKSKPHHKSFSVYKFGFEGAKERAIAARREAEALYGYLC